MYDDNVNSFNKNEMSLLSSKGIEPLRYRYQQYILPLYYELIIPDITFILAC